MRKLPFLLLAAALVFASPLALRVLLDVHALDAEGRALQRNGAADHGDGLRAARRRDGRSGAGHRGHGHHAAALAARLAARSRACGDGEECCGDDDGPVQAHR